MALSTRPDFRRRVTVYLDGWTGETRTATYAGRCVLCGTRTYDDDGGNDPRGPMGDHAAAPMIAADYGATGQDVPACFLCGNNDEPTYRRLLARARRVGRWTHPEPDRNTCYRCDAPVQLRGADGSQYAGWRHAGPPELPADLSQWARDNRTAPHEARPSRTAEPDCRDRYHHFSGAWCATCGGWG